MDSGQVRMIDHHLADRRGVVLIDGVDELPVGDRPNLWDWVDRWNENHPGNRCYITSRQFASKARKKSWDPPSEFEVADLNPMSIEDMDEFIDNWVLMSNNDGTYEAAYNYWILGREETQRQPRWSVVRNVLHWVD